MGELLILLVTDLEIILFLFVVRNNNEMETIFLTWSGNLRMLSTKYWYDFQSPAITSPKTGII